VATVASARHALELFARGATFEVVLCELNMPEMDGVTLCEQLAFMESELAARVVLMSEGVPDAPMRAALEGVSNPCISRPFETGTLVAFLEACRARNQGPERIGCSPGHLGQGQPPDAECVFALAVRLMRGEVLHLADKQGWAWCASATTLSLENPSSHVASAIVRGSAADVAIEIVRRGLRPRDASSSVA
jgi:CheY-like chemotaxis protein